MNIAGVLQERVSRTPEAIAFIEADGGADRTFTFAGFGAGCERAAAALAARGVGEGDAVLVLQPMSVALYTVLVALWRLGAVPVFLDPSAGRDHIAHCCEIASPCALITSRKAMLLRLTSGALRRIPVAIGTRKLVGARASALPGPIATLCADAPALITFTSGSTGAPKAAMRTHGFLIAQRDVLTRHLSLEEGQTDLATLPIFVLANLAAGVTTVIPHADLRRVGAIEPTPVLAQITRSRVTRTGASPAFLERLAVHCERTGTSLTSLERVFTGGAPVFPPLLDRLQAIAPNATITAVYGSTEAEPIAHLSLDDISADDRIAMRHGAGLVVGHPVEEIELRILPFGGTDTAHPLPPDEPGEIVVSGPHVLRGYLNGTGDAETKFDAEGRRWHRTGDAGYLGPDGRLWLLGRVGQRISDDRGDVYPFQVECAIAGMPGITRSALIAHEGRRLLVIEEDAGGADLATIRERLDWAHLGEIRSAHRIPVDRRHNAKIDYPALRRTIEKE